MTRFTEKTIRTNGKWVKITRDNKQRTFTFAIGYQGEFTAYQIEGTLSFKWVANWTEATERAMRLATI
jgi:hypothetical protein